MCGVHGLGQAFDSHVNVIVHATERDTTAEAGETEIDDGIIL